MPNTRLETSTGLGIRERAKTRGAKQIEVGASVTPGMMARNVLLGVLRCLWYG
jgi:hypothetical protein